MTHKPLSQLSHLKWTKPKASRKLGAVHLVYSDDGRLDTMIEILSEVATRMQVILLTCRDRAFRHVPGNRLLMKIS